MYAEFKLTNLINDLQSPWSITIVKKNTYLINEKSGNIKIFDRFKNTVKKIKHNLKVLEQSAKKTIRPSIIIKAKFMFRIQRRDNNMKSSTSVSG